ncbi:DUF2155 domain-containing protein [Allosphingosinicella deserti]|uniref:DUF2155 domain-containing protein n=1 Tax=Allosphingosinicella deserti TaxID=2116704 RepID=A0A2P7QF05_9SPHN|nr:DUF2155 domain-containing protein [Sphingomonas deserti]PSJ36553.1 DUF2155 domain-containing protein [Sphingomonas deserti]
MSRRTCRAAALAALAALAACGGEGNQQKKAGKQNEPEPQTVDIPQTVTALAPGTTPMAQRVAVVSLLNKRNGSARDLTMKPGEALRVGDVIVRLRACETTAPWEVQKLTGAFVQLDVRNPQGQFQRAFSGWLYKETPSLNVVEHPIYDVTPKSCAMTHPEAGESTVQAGADGNRAAPPRAGGTRRPRADAPAAPAATAREPAAPPPATAPAEAAAPQ